MTLNDIYGTHVESPGTKVYSLSEAATLSRKFSRCELRTQLSEVDLLIGQAGHRHGGSLLTLARQLWPRRLIERLFPPQGLFLMVEAAK